MHVPILHAGTVSCFVKGNIYGTSSEKTVPQKTKLNVSTWRADSARKQIKLYQRKCSYIKIKSYSDMNPVNFIWCRSIRFFRWKKAAVDTSVNRFYFITNELKMVLQFFSYFFTDNLFFDIFTVLSLACNSSWEQSLSAIFPLVWQPFTFAILWRTPSLLFGGGLTFWVASSVRPTKPLLLNLY